MSAPTLRLAESLAKSVKVVITPISEAVTVTEVGFTAVLDKSDASFTAEALIVGYTGTSIVLPEPLIG